KQPEPVPGALAERFPMAVRPGIVQPAQGRPVNGRPRAPDRAARLMAAEAAARSDGLSGSQGGNPAETQSGKQSRRHLSDGKKPDARLPFRLERSGRLRQGQLPVVSHEEDAGPGAKQRQRPAALVVPAAAGRVRTYRRSVDEGGLFAGEGRQQGFRIHAAFEKPAFVYASPVCPDPSGPTGEAEAKAGLSRARAANRASGAMPLSSPGTTTVRTAIRRKSMSAERGARRSVNTASPGSVKAASSLSSASSAPDVRAVTVRPSGAPSARSHSRRPRLADVSSALPAGSGGSFPSLAAAMARYRSSSHSVPDSRLFPGQPPIQLINRSTALP